MEANPSLQNPFATFRILRPSVQSRLADDETFGIIYYIRTRTQEPTGYAEHPEFQPLV